MRLLPADHSVPLDGGGGAPLQGTQQEHQHHDRVPEDQHGRNYNIINELRKREDRAATAQAAAAARRAQLSAPTAPPTARIQQVDGAASSTPARVSPSPRSSSSRSDPSPGAYDDEDGYYDDDRPLGRQRRVIGRQGKADKVPAWVGSGTERWQEYRTSLCAWFYANRDFLTEGQIISKIGEMFKSAGETAAADSLLGYSQLDSTIPPFEDIIHDLDSLYKVNRIGNSLDIELFHI